MITPEQQLQMVIESLRLVAAPAEQQLAALPEYVCITDEVMLTYYDAFLLVPQLVDAGLIEATAAESLTHLDNWFEDPQDPSITDPESLKTHAYWATARTLAAEALGQLGKDVVPPDLSYIFWSQ